MRLVDGKHVIQQFAAAAADPALGDAVLPRTADRGPHSRDVHRANYGGNFPAVLGVVVQDKKLGGWFIGDSAQSKQSFRICRGSARL